MATTWPNRAKGRDGKENTVDVARGKNRAPEAKAGPSCVNNSQTSRLPTHIVPHLHNVAHEMWQDYGKFLHATCSLWQRMRDSEAYRQGAKYNTSCLVTPQRLTSSPVQPHHRYATSATNYWVPA